MNPLKPGFRFNPEDHELLHYYLRNKVLGKPLPLLIRDLDLYHPNSPKPWQIFQGCTAKDAFFFTRITRQHSRWDRLDRQSAGGTYKINARKEDIRVDTPFQENLLIGFIENLNFVDTGSSTLSATHDNHCNWILDQISLSNYPVVMGDDDDQQRWVVCRLRPGNLIKGLQDDTTDGDMPVVPPPSKRAKTSSNTIHHNYTQKQQLPHYSHCMPSTSQHISPTSMQQEAHWGDQLTSDPDDMSFMEPVCSREHPQHSEQAMSQKMLEFHALISSQDDVALVEKDLLQQQQLPHYSHCMPSTSQQISPTSMQQEAHRVDQLICDTDEKSFMAPVYSGEHPQQCEQAISQRMLESHALISSQDDANVSLAEKDLQQQQLPVGHFHYSDGIPIPHDMPQFHYSNGMPRSESTSAQPEKQCAVLGAIDAYMIEWMCSEYEGDHPQPSEDVLSKTVLEFENCLVTAT